MSALIDARGLSCPEPAMNARKAMLAAGGGTIRILLDSVASRENVTRAAAHLGWQAVSESLPGGEFRMTLTK